jgi:hypothetical protein
MVLSADDKLLGLLELVNSEYPLVVFPMSTRLFPETAGVSSHLYWNFRQDLLPVHTGHGLLACGDQDCVLTGYFVHVFL